MKLADFRRAGHWPSLLCAFLYFDVSFMIWVLLGPLAPAIAAELLPRPADMDLDVYLRQTAAAKGMRVSIPLLGGSILRLVLGVLTDRMGARRTGLLGMTLTAAPLLLGWLWADSFGALVLVGLLPPTRSISRSCSTRNSTTWISGGKSPISSRKIVPPFADSKRPNRRCVAPPSHDRRVRKQ